jgi:hypothetical protein
VPRDPVRSTVYDDSIYIKNSSRFLAPQYLRSCCLWNLINYYKVGNINTKQDLLHLTLILEEQVQNIIAINSITNSCTNNTSSINYQFDSLIEFYSCWELSSKTNKHLAISFHQQILNPPIKSAPLPLNRFEAFEDLEQIMLDMEIDHKSYPPPSQNPTPQYLNRYGTMTPLSRSCRINCLPIWNNNENSLKKLENLRAMHQRMRILCHLLNPLPL